MATQEQTNLPDALNAEFLYSCTSTKLLVDIAQGKINAKHLAFTELKKRGLDADGKWVGFKTDWDKEEIAKEERVKRRNK